MLDRVWVLGALVACGGTSKTDTLVDRGQYVDACKSTDFAYSRKLADKLAEITAATVTVTVWKAVDALRVAEVSMPAKDDTWMGVAIELAHNGKPGEVVEMGIKSTELRADAWQIRGGLGLGDSYKLLTGKTYEPPNGVSIGDIGRFAKEAILLKPDAKAQLTSAAGTDDVDGIVAAQRLAELWSNECGVKPGGKCRAARILMKDPAVKAKAALAISVRYAVADAAGAHCTQVEHIVVELAPGADLAAQIAATFPSPTTLVELRKRARVTAYESESAF